MKIPKIKSQDLPSPHLCLILKVIHKIVCGIIFQHSNELFCEIDNSNETFNTNLCIFVP